MGALPLVCHVASPTTAVERLSAQAALDDEGRLTVSFELCGDVGRVRVPPPAFPVRDDRLWEHTCFEAFVGIGPRAYVELNCAPSLAWNCYRFDDYRAGMRAAELESPPQLAVSVEDERLELTATLTILPWTRTAPRLDIGLTAVIEEADGRRSYWALKHPAARPDFHLRESFAVALQRPTARSGLAP